MKQQNTKEIIVIGAGPGGYAAAFRAADLGKKVTLIDKDVELGGVCLNRGCIPSKALLHISKTILDAEHLAKMGVHFNKPEINVDQIRNHKNKIVNKLNKGISQMAKARGVEVLCGEVSFISNNELLIKSKSGEPTLLFEKCIIATGSRSTTLPLAPEKNNNILTSKTALDLNNIPDSLLVVGGGIIGLELGQVYSSFGSKVSVVEFLPNLISDADKDIVKPLQNQLDRQFENIYLSSKVVSIVQNKKTLKVTIEKNGELFDQEFDKALIAVGRKPNVEALNMKNTDVIVEDGFIPVNEYQQTNIDNIYAIGDIVGNPMLAHKATHQGKVAAEVCAGIPSAFDVEVIPSVVYTDPEVAWVGLTEKEADEKNISYKKGEFPWVASGRATAVGSTYGKTKILFSPENDKILGVGIVGTGAGDLISEAVLAIEMGVDAEDLSLTVHPHPTLSETVAMASEVYTKTITDLYIP